MTDRPREGEPLNQDQLYTAAYYAFEQVGDRKSIALFRELVQGMLQNVVGREASEEEVTAAIELLKEKNGVRETAHNFMFQDAVREKQSLDGEPEPDEEPDVDDDEDNDDDIFGDATDDSDDEPAADADDDDIFGDRDQFDGNEPGDGADDAPDDADGGDNDDDIFGDMDQFDENNTNEQGESDVDDAEEDSGDASIEDADDDDIFGDMDQFDENGADEEQEEIEDDDDTPDTTEDTPVVDTRDATTADTEPTEEDTEETAAATPEPAPTPTPHHSVHMNERRFNRWANKVARMHERMLHIVARLENEDLKPLKEAFKAETGQDWHEAFEVHQYIAEQRINNAEVQFEDEFLEEESHLLSHSRHTAEHIKNVLSDKGLPDKKTGNADLDDLIDIIRHEGVDHRSAVDEFMSDLREEEWRKSDYHELKTERMLYMRMAAMLDKLEAFHATVAAENFDENPPELEAARTTFLKAQEDFNEFERKILRNPFTSGKKRKELLRNLEEARTAYETESAKVIAGRANRFLGEYNKQIDEEIRIRDERRGDKGDGFFAKLKNTFYAGYKWLGDMSLDRLYRAQKHGDADAAKGNPRVEGNEPRGGQMIRKAANLRSAIGFGLGLAGLMSGPLKTVWRGAVGLGTGVGVYEGLKARTTAQLQSETHELLRQYADSTQDNPGRQLIIDTMQQIRMRAALDGKTVEDERFPLHESFAKLRTILEHEKRKLPEVSREQAYKNKDAILAALKGINADLEKQITDQSEQKRKQVLGAIAAGGASALVAPKVMELLGWGAEQIADWIVGDPAVSADVGPYPDDVVPPPEVPPTPPEIPEVIRAGEGFRVSLDNGEGAYHAVYKILDELSPAEQAELGEAIAKEHPEWVSRDANGDITNLDRVLRSWRHDIVDSAILDDGREAMLYDASTGEYGVMLHEGAQFSIEYDADGYPQLRLHGDAESGDYNILNENLIRTVDADGRGNFMTADEYQEHIAAEQAAASEPEVATPDAVEADTTSNTELVPDAVGDTMDRIAALGEQLDAAFEDGSLAGEASASADSPYEMLGDTPRDVDYPTVDDLEADDTLQEADALARTEALASQFTLDGGHTVEIVHTEGGDIAGINIDAGLLSNREVQYALLPEGSNPYAGVPMSERSSYDALLKRIYLMDEAVDQMIASGMQGTEEYDYLVSAVEADMQLAAERASTDVGTLFDRDIAEAYDFEVPEDTASSAVDAASGETFEARMDELRSSFEDSVNQMSPGELNVLETDVYTEFQSLLNEGRDILATEPQPSADQLARLEGIVEELDTIHTNFEAGIGVEPEALAAEEVVVATELSQPELVTEDLVDRIRSVRTNSTSTEINQIRDYLTLLGSYAEDLVQAQSDAELRQIYEQAAGVQADLDTLLSEIEARN